MQGKVKFCLYPEASSYKSFIHYCKYTDMQMRLWRLHLIWLSLTKFNLLHSFHPIASLISMLQKNIYSKFLWFIVKVSIEFDVLIYRPFCIDVKFLSQFSSIAPAASCNNLSFGFVMLINFSLPFDNIRQL